MADRTSPSAISNVGKNWDSVHAVWLDIHHWLTTRRKISTPGCTNGYSKLKDAIDKFSSQGFWDFYPKILQLGISWRGKFIGNHDFPVMQNCSSILCCWVGAGQYSWRIQLRSKEWFSSVSGMTSNCVRWASLFRSSKSGASGRAIMDYYYDIRIFRGHLFSHTCTLFTRGYWRCIARWRIIWQEVSVRDYLVESGPNFIFWLLPNSYELIRPVHCTS
jgi:hypothetical protein